MLINVQSKDLATEISQKLPAVALATLLSTLAGGGVALSADYSPPPIVQQQDHSPSSFNVEGAINLTAPEVKAEHQLPEGILWRYSEFISAVENGLIERVRFSRDGTQLQLNAVDGRRAAVVLPNDPELVDVLAKHGVDISVSEGDQQGDYVALLGNILFPLIAFGGLFLLFRRSQNGQGRWLWLLWLHCVSRHMLAPPCPTNLCHRAPHDAGGGPMGPMGGPMEFGRSKSKFQEVPETGVTFDDVAVSAPTHYSCAMPQLTPTAGQHANLGTNSAPSPMRPPLPRPQRPTHLPVRGHTPSPRPSPSGL